MLNELPSPSALVALYVMIRPSRSRDIPAALLREGHAELVELGLASWDEDGNVALTDKGEELTLGVAGALS